MKLTFGSYLIMEVVRAQQLMTTEPDMASATIISNRVQAMMSFIVLECGFISYVYSTSREITTSERNAISS